MEFKKFSTRKASYTVTPDVPEENSDISSEIEDDNRVVAQQDSFKTNEPLDFNTNPHGLVQRTERKLKEILSDTRHEEFSGL